MTTQPKFRIVFPSYDWDDAWLVNQIINRPIVVGREEVGFIKGVPAEEGLTDPKAIENWIRRNMEGCSCLILFVGEKTYQSDWVKFELLLARNTWPASSSTLTACAEKTAASVATESILTAITASTLPAPATISTNTIGSATTGQKTSANGSKKPAYALASNAIAINAAATAGYTIVEKFQSMSFQMDAASSFVGLNIQASK